MMLQDPIKPREIEVLRLMAEGLTNREIGERLYIGAETVKWYASEIYSKLHVSNRREAVKEAQLLGLLDDEEQAEQSSYLMKSNLPQQATPFIGRKQELDTVRELVEQDTTRVVTILAPGGMGKTRLAIEVASQLLDSQQFRDGAFFIPLQQLSDSRRYYPCDSNSDGI